MARGYDGSIRIDTRIDEKGFNAGVKNISTSVRSMGRKIAEGALQMAVGFARAVTKITLILFVVSKLIGAIKNAVNNVINMGSRTAALKQDFENLKLSVRNAFLPLLQVALPLLQAVAQWLTRIFNLIGSVFAAFSGQTTVMRATADAAADAAGSTGEMADSAKEAEKAAKGSLAAFDEINVLQQEEEKTETGGGGGAAGGGGFTLEPISQEILSFVQSLKDFFAPLWEPLQNLWNAIKGLGAAIWEAIKPLFGGLADSGFLEFLRDLAIHGIEWLTEKIIQLTEWINNNQEAFQRMFLVISAVAVALLIVLSPTAAVIALILALVAAIILVIYYWPQIKDKAIEVWNKIKEVWGTVANWFINAVWTPIKNWAVETATNIAMFFYNAWLSIKTIWTNVKTWFGDIFDAISEKWDTFTDNLKDGLKSALNTALGWVEGFVNFFVKAINLMIELLNKLSIPIPNIPFLGLNGGTIGFNIAPLGEISIPRLATGAVIPPNSQFLAVMGDQRSGRNLEAPEDLIRQIVREETAQPNVNINFTGSLAGLARVLKPEIVREDRRIGLSLARGSTR